MDKPCADNAVVEPTSCQGSVTHSATFETMPPEILDCIIQFVGANLILPLCHSMPYYKYVSEAMFNFAHRFPNQRYRPYMLWPDMYLPGVPNEPSKTIDFPMQHLLAAAMYARIISKNGGNVHADLFQKIHCTLAHFLKYCLYTMVATVQALDGVTLSCGMQTKKESNVVNWKHSRRARNGRKPPSN
ncbi:hypothetical protein BJ741DRAFT_638968 [Chytriomyces cf. hyalinus JEL632]|nr:hypothetical protein BJ741DRAFT_638968 [Chytriomyces cf. hyalinus JEL632]